MMLSRIWRWLAGTAAVLVLATAVLAMLPPSGPPPTAPGVPPPEGQRFTASDAAVLAVRDWQPVKTPRLVLVAVHGMNDYGMAFDRPARLWASLGIATYALDLRGFGRSLTRGRWYGGVRMADDVVELARHLRTIHPDVPLALVGESMGGAVAVLAAARAGDGVFDALVLSAPAIWGEGWRSWAAFEAARLTGTLAGWITVPPLNPENRSTDDPAAWNRLRTDPLIIHRTRLDTLAGIVALMADAANAAGTVRLPALVMLGDMDRHVPRDGVATLLKRLPPGTGLALYPKGRHLLFRSLDGDAAARDVAAWLLARDRPSSEAERRGRLCATLVLHPEGPCPD